MEVVLVDGTGYYDRGKRYWFLRVGSAKITGRYGLAAACNEIRRWSWVPNRGGDNRKRLVGKLGQHLQTWSDVSYNSGWARHAAQDLVEHLVREGVFTTKPFALDHDSLDAWEVRGTLLLEEP